MRSSAALILLLLITAGPLSGGVIDIDVPECDATFASSSEGTRITAPGYSTCGSPGDPALPYKDIDVILPPGAILSSVSAILAGAQVSRLPGSYDLAPTPPLAASLEEDTIYDWGPGKQIESGRNVLVYSQDAFYPSSSITVQNTGRLRGWRLARVRYYPYRYNPVTGALERFTGGHISVSYDERSASAQSMRGPSDSRLSLRLVRSSANYKAAAKWYGKSTESLNAAAGVSVQSTADYVVLTTSDIANGSTKLQDFVAHKQSRGFNTAVLTESDWGGGTGDAAANSIRAYLQAHYASMGMQYLLLIGNPNPTSGDVPMKMLWPRNNFTTYREAPSDYFYADLTGNWDLDGDGYYGEQYQDFGTGGVDRYPELAVGRIPFYGSFTDLDSILQKTIDYESNLNGGGWTRNVLVSMEPSDGSTPGYHLGEAIMNDAASPIGFDTMRVYEETYDLTPAPEYVPCSYDNVLAAWQQHVGFHFWWTHGSATSATDVFTSTRCQYLDDSYPSFVFQCSCHNGSPENSGNLGYSLLRQGAIATDAASRVSWYYPGQTVYSNTDSNAGMTYRYAVNLVRDHLSCGDAHYQMMVQVPNGIWMNHCVFNLYGDPSVAYVSAPIIMHQVHPDTDITTSSYAIEARVVTSNPLAQGSPVVHWSADGSSYDTVPMGQSGADTYTGYIPPQLHGTTVYYYIEAEDVGGQASTSPADAPAQVYSFNVRQDLQPPVVLHTALSDTGDIYGPYPVEAIVTDDLGVADATLYYARNGGPENSVEMQLAEGSVYQASIPGPSSAGDVIAYYIVATDCSVESKTTREPAAPGVYSFAITQRRSIGIYNSYTTPAYFVGGITNGYSQAAEVLDSDPYQRFQVTILTGLSASDLVGKDAIVLPDNGVLVEDLDAVADWFVPGKTIVAMDSAANYAAYSGWLWPDAVGTNGCTTHWDYGAGTNDQEIWCADPITAGYEVGDVIESWPYQAECFTSRLPEDAVALTVKHGDSTLCYAAYRDVPGGGRLVFLGPYVSIAQSEYSIFRESLVGEIGEPALQITSPNGAEIYAAGDTVVVLFTAWGNWDTSDTVSLDYRLLPSGTWQPIQGAESLPCNAGYFCWDTTDLPAGSYAVRVTQSGGSIGDESDEPFSIAPLMSIAEAKSVPDGGLAAFAEKLVTCNVDGWSYVQEPDRSAGIRVISDSYLPVSYRTNLVGTMSTVDGERVLYAQSRDQYGIDAETIPMATNTTNIGGAAFGLQDPVMEYRLVLENGEWVKRLVQGVGLNNIGLLLKVAGCVTAIGDGYFYIDDGGACDDGSGDTGVKVISGQFTQPAVGDYIMLTAVSSTYFDRGYLFKALVMPSEDSLTILEP